MRDEIIFWSCPIWFSLCVLFIQMKLTGRALPKMEVYTWRNAPTKFSLWNFQIVMTKSYQLPKYFFRILSFSYSKILENKWSILVENLIQHKPLISEKWGGPYHLYSNPILWHLPWLNDIFERGVLILFFCFLWRSPLG